MLITFFNKSICLWFGNVVLDGADWHLLTKSSFNANLSVKKLIFLIFFLFLDVEKGAIHKIGQDTQNENIAFIDEDASNGNVRNFLFNILFIFYFLIGWAKEILF